MKIDEDPNAFLQPTEYCDSTHSNIQEVANRITKNHVSQKDKAVCLFYWVRDSVLYRVGRWQTRASVTLAERNGTCTNKANLLVALLRANNIPASYGVMKVDGQRYLGPIALPMLSKFIGKVSTHIYALAFLDNRWIKCDATDDKEFCDNTAHFNPTTRLVEWDGTSDATLNLNQAHILKDDHPIANIDRWMANKQRGMIIRGRGIPVSIGNIYIEFLRKNGRRVNNTSELETLFKDWLRKNHPWYFRGLSMLSWFKSEKAEENPRSVT
jgi:hypothetical protein